jgi:hypothetical protein
LYALDSFLSLVAGSAPDAAVILVGNMADREEERKVSFAEAEAFAHARGMTYIEVSARTGTNVSEAFNSLFYPPPTLLWRGSRDGFRAIDFHGRCDGHAPTLTMIEDTRGNIFGGFTPIAWESRFFRGRLSDETMTGFLFSAQNPHGIALQRFGLIDSQQHTAITVSSRTGPWFGEEDLVISDHCDTAPSHARGFGRTYANATSIEGRLLFTGSETFVVKEIEVFECSPPRLQ